MDWSAEEFVLAITAFLFLGLVAFSFLPRVKLTLRSRATFAIGAAMFLGTAAALARIENVQYPVFIWVLPVIPMVVIGILARDAYIAAQSTIDTSTEPVGVRRASAFPAGQESSTEYVLHMLRERAANPKASPQELASIAYMNPSIRATIAGNPAAPASLLEWLASVGDSSVQAAISARATTSPSDYESDHQAIADNALRATQHQAA